MENNQMIIDVVPMNDHNDAMVEDVVSMNEDVAMPLESYHERSVARYDSNVLSLMNSSVGTFSGRSNGSTLRLGSSLENIFEESLERNITLTGVTPESYDIWWQRSNRIIITPHDILIGKSPNYRAHVGNAWLRSLLEAHAQEYWNCRKKTQKGEIITSIVDTVHRNGGRFLRKDKKDEWVVEESSNEQREVVSSRFRGMKKGDHQTFACFPDVRRSKN